MTTLQTLFEQHLSTLTGSATETSLNHYRRWTSKFWIFIGDRRPDEVTLREVNEFILKRCSEVKGKTVKYFRQVIVRFFIWMEDNGIIAKNPLKPSKLPRLTIVPFHKPSFSEEQYRQMIEEAANNERQYSWGEVFVLGWNTGLRLGDCCNLLWKQVDFENRMIRVIPQKTRRFNKQLDIPMTEELFDVLKRLKDSPKYPSLGKGPHVFPDMAWTLPSAKGNATYHFNQILKKCGIPKGYSFHSFRHSFCSRLINSGVSILVVQSMTGQTLEVLQGYVTVSPEAKRAALGIK